MQIYFCVESFKLLIVLLVWSIFAFVHARTPGVMWCLQYACQPFWFIGVWTPCRAHHMRIWLLLFRIMLKVWLLKKKNNAHWNWTFGADHFVVTCYDVRVWAFEGLPFLKNISFVVYSLSYDVVNILHKDVALPQLWKPFPLPAGKNDIENRFEQGSILLFIWIQFIHTLSLQPDKNWWHSHFPF